MKILHIKAEIEADVLPSVEANAGKLPQNIGLLTTVQHISQLDKVKEFLETKGKKIFIGKSRKTQYKGQILGCDFESAKSIAENVDAFLYIGTGRFHPLGIILNTDKPVIAIDPLTKEIKEHSKKDVEKIEKRRKAALAKFYSSKNIGIIATTKPGQQQLKKAVELKKRLKEKNSCIFLADTLDFTELENFPFIGCYVNTGCPRIGLDDTIRTSKPMINIDDIE